MRSWMWRLIVEASFKVLWLTSPRFRETADKMMDAPLPPSITDFADDLLHHKDDRDAGHLR